MQILALKSFLNFHALSTYMCMWCGIVIKSNGGFELPAAINCEGSRAMGHFTNVAVLRPWGVCCKT